MHAPTWYGWDDGVSAATPVPIMKRHGKVGSACGCLDGHIEYIRTDQFDKSKDPQPIRPTPIWCEPGKADGGRLGW